MWMTKYWHFRRICHSVLKINNEKWKSSSFNSQQVHSQEWCNCFKCFISVENVCLSLQRSTGPSTLKYCTNIFCWWTQLKLVRNQLRTLASIRPWRGQHTQRTDYNRSHTVTYSVSALRSAHLHLQVTLLTAAARSLSPQYHRRSVSSLCQLHISHLQLLLLHHLQI